MQAFFVAARGAGPGRRFAIHHAAARAPRALVVCVQPFFEEMNKSRRMLALQSRAFAAAGCAVLQIDLGGAGDSDGDLAGADWSGWIDDALLAADWLRREHGSGPPLWWWGLRGGCLLAAAAAGTAGGDCLFWQPPASGKPLLQQFLRLKAAADLQSGQGGAVMAALRAQLQRGEAVDIAGYRLGAALAHGIETAALQPPARAGRLVWLDVSSRAELSPASQGCIDRWAAAGWSVEPRVVEGPAFWQTVEIAEAPALLRATLDALCASPVPA